MTAITIRCKAHPGPTRYQGTDCATCAELVEMAAEGFKMQAEAIADGDTDAASVEFVFT